MSQALSQFSAVDHQHMALALRLAERGRFSVRPNPCVGCVIADGETVLGCGFHQRAGQAHAEVFALAEAGAKARGASAYVSLEPCAHFGRTPPCADALIAAGVARVVIATGDSFAAVAGKGVEKLRQAGIVVETGLMHEQARALNVGFFSRIERQKPWVRLKMAMSLDGQTALENGASQWITGVAARADVQAWRARSGAILTGIGTVLADDPALTVRDWREAVPDQPLKIVLDRRLRCPASARLFDEHSGILIVHQTGVEPDRVAQLSERGAELLAWPTTSDLAPHVQDPEQSKRALESVLVTLAARQINELWIEAGARLAGAWLHANLVDELVIYQAPMLLGLSARGAFDWPALRQLDQAPRFETHERRVIGEDLRLTLRRN